MNTVVSYAFHILVFPREGKIVTIDHLDYYVPSAQISTMRNPVPLVGDNPSQFKSFGVGLFISSSLMGVFPQLPSPDIPSSSSKYSIHAISSNTCGPQIPPNPWVVSPSLMEVDQGSEHSPPPFV